MRGAALSALLCGAAAATGVAADEPAASGATTSIWDGVYSAEQAQRGAEIYAEPCGKCHGYRLNGAPDDPDMFPTRPVAGSKFLRDWDGRSLGVLFEYTRSTMPANNPSYLSDREYADLLAYLLAESGAPAGDAALSSDVRELGRIVITRER